MWSWGNLQYLIMFTLDPSYETFRHIEHKGNSDHSEKYVKTCQNSNEATIQLASWMIRFGRAGRIAVPRALTANKWNIWNMIQYVIYVMHQRMWKKPPGIPNLMQKLKDLGYALQGYFTSSEIYRVSTFFHINQHSSAAKVHTGDESIVKAFVARFAGHWRWHSGGSFQDNFNVY